MDGMDVNCMDRYGRQQAGKESGFGGLKKINLDT